MRPSAKRCESPESFQDWLSRPRSVRRSYSTKPSPSRSPYSSIHCERPQRRLAEVADERGVVRPAPDLGEQDEVERRRVDRPVVGAEPVARGLAVPHLVDDLARLGVDRRIVLGRLQLGEHLERGARQLGPEEQRLQARDQRVAAEDGHEPRHPGGRQLADAVAAAHPQRGEVGDRLRRTSAAGRPRSRGAAARAAARPRATRARARARRRSGARASSGCTSSAVERDGDVDDDVPRRPRLELDPPADRRAVALARAARRITCVAAENSSSGSTKRNWRSSASDRCGARRRQRLGARAGRRARSRAP